MLIALDFDATYTLDPDLWNEFIDKAISRGHKVICVTMRYDYEGTLLKKTIGKKCDIIFTNRKAKRPFLLNKKIKPNVWIDDEPKWIDRDSV